MSRNFNEAERQKLIQLIKEGSSVLGEIDDLRSGLKDTVKAVSEELEIKPGIINKAITIAHKDTYKNDRDDKDLLDAILSDAGKI